MGKRKYNTQHHTKRKLPKQRHYNMHSVSTTTH